ncbi:MAG: hypothetical protein HWQ41_23550 [Nostoc sp. NOS(2021)]|uniref:hypothetical protein n=1 Tax=Nostoc sp. NOS(2021) TaxID=2815407 RepID=UPI0025E950F1|nr:hypothetical protein [Nostoc sp. NOS(2021)]MBN3898137.1 hypothetical protein [Nostoc sp. NOS(2021)]
MHGIVKGRLESARQLLPCGNAKSEQVGKAAASRSWGKPPDARGLANAALSPWRLPFSQRERLVAPQRTGSSTRGKTHLRGLKNLNFLLVQGGGLCLSSREFHSLGLAPLARVASK